VSIYRQRSSGHDFAVDSAKLKERKEEPAHRQISGNLKSVELRSAPAQEGDSDVSTIGLDDWSNWQRDSTASGIRGNMGSGIKR
jgi:hypothetical protein